MSITRWLLRRASLTPYYHLAGYMDRYWLVPYRAHLESAAGTGCGPVSFWRRPLAWVLQCLGIAVRIHLILRSDDDRAFHDHPWPYLTVILRGGYYEVRPQFDKSGIYQGATRKWHGPGSVLLRRARSWHRLELPPDGVAVTLFITGPKRQAWGFMPSPQTNKVYYRQYLEDYNHG